MKIKIQLYDHDIMQSRSLPALRFLNLCERSIIVLLHTVC